MVSRFLFAFRFLATLMALASGQWPNRWGHGMIAPSLLPREPFCRVFPADSSENSPGRNSSCPSYILRARRSGSSAWHRIRAPPTRVVSDHARGRTARGILLNFSLLFSSALCRVQIPTGISKRREGDAYKFLPARRTVFQFPTSNACRCTARC